MAEVMVIVLPIESVMQGLPRYPTRASPNLRRRQGDIVNACFTITQYNCVIRNAGGRQNLAGPAHQKSARARHAAPKWSGIPKDAGMWGCSQPEWSVGCAIPDGSGRRPRVSARDPRPARALRRARFARSSQIARWRRRRPSERGMTREVRLCRPINPPARAISRRRR